MGGGATVVGFKNTMAAVTVFTLGVCCPILGGLCMNGIEKPACGPVGFDGCGCGVGHQTGHGPARIDLGDEKIGFLVQSQVAGDAVHLGDAPLCIMGQFLDRLMTAHTAKPSVNAGV